jgi:hypothetical protein
MKVRATLVRVGLPDESGKDAVPIPARFPLDLANVIVGRSAASDLVLDNSAFTGMISRTHARISRTVSAAARSASASGAAGGASGEHDAVSGRGSSSSSSSSSGGGAVSSTRWVVSDLKSMNGVFVNAVKVQEATLRDGDVITFGGPRHLKVKQSCAASKLPSIYQFTFETEEVPLAVPLAVLEGSKTAAVVPVVENMVVSGVPASSSAVASAVEMLGGTEEGTEEGRDGDDEAREGGSEEDGESYEGGDEEDEEDEEDMEENILEDEEDDDEEDEGEDEEERAAASAAARASARAAASAAASSAALRGIAEELLCCICQELLCVAHSLPCGHSYCAPCTSAREECRGGGGRGGAKRGESLREGKERRESMNRARRFRLQCVLWWDPSHISHIADCTTSVHCPPFCVAFCTLHTSAHTHTHPYAHHSYAHHPFTTLLYSALSAPIHPRSLPPFSATQVLWNGLTDHR